MDDDAPAKRRQVPVVWIAGLVAVALGVALVVHAAPWLAAPFGDSHDGRNAAVWGTSARGLREAPLGSHLGGINPAGEPYATHPPAIVAAAALTSTVVGDRPVSYRLPPVLASLATIGLLAALLVRMRFGGLATATALILSGTSVMFLVYGTMLDTPMIGLPLSAAVLLLAAGVQRDEPPPLWLLVVVGAGCGLTSWQAGLTAGVTGLLLLVEPAPRARRIRLVGGLYGGLALGVAAAFAWAWWAYGDLSSVIDAFQTRTGAADGWWQAQQDVASSTFGSARLAMVGLGAVVALVRRRHRLIMAAAVATPVIWDVAFREGATVHDYWLYSGVLAVAVGTAIVIEGVVDGTRRFVPRLQPLVVGLVCVLTAYAAVVALTKASLPEDTVRSGIDGGRLAAEVPPAERPDQVVVSVGPGGPSAPAGWVAWRSGGVVAALDADQLRDLARSDPDALVLVRSDVGSVPSDAIVDATIATRGGFRLVRASAFASS